MACGILKDGASISISMMRKYCFAEQILPYSAFLKILIVEISPGTGPCSWYRDHWTDDRVIMRSGPGEFRRELGETIGIDTSYGSIPESDGKRTDRPHRDH